MITEEQMPLESMKKKAKSHKCGICGSLLNVAWGGFYGIDGYILKCSKDINHNCLTDYKKPTLEYEEGNKLFRRLNGMDTTALMKMNETQMMARIAQAKFPKDLTAVEKKLMAEVSISYGLDPLMQELMIYQGNPYPTINARYRKAQETGKFDGINTRPATKAEREARHAKEGDFLYCAEVWVKGSSHPFIGWGRVRAAETKGSEHLPIVKDPDRQAEKRAEAMGLRKAFSMPIPFQSWEEFQEQTASEIINGREVNTKTGEVLSRIDAPFDISKENPESEVEGKPESDIVEGETREIEPKTEPENKSGELDLFPEGSDKDNTKPDEETKESVKDERKVTEEELHALNELMAKAEMTASDLGAYCNRDMKWNIKTTADLLKWQYDNIVAKIKKGSP